MRIKAQKLSAAVSVIILHSDPSETGKWSRRAFKSKSTQKGILNTQIRKMEAVREQ